MTQTNPEVQISRDSRGYYVLTIDGVFIGNYDTLSEAADEAEEMLFGAVSKAV